MCCPCFGVSSPAPLPSRLTGSPHPPGVRLLLDFSHPALSQLPGPAREGLAWPLAIAWQGRVCENTPPHQVSVQALQGGCGGGTLVSLRSPPTAGPSPRATPSCSGRLVKHGPTCTALTFAIERTPALTLGRQGQSTPSLHSATGGQQGAPLMGTCHPPARPGRRIFSGSVHLTRRAVTAVARTGLFFFMFF